MICFKVRRGTRIALLVLGALLSGACTDGEGPEQQDEGGRAPPSVVPERTGETYVYACGDGLRFTARIEGEKAWLFLPSGTIDLPHVVAASGAKYSDGSVTFWTKGESATLERANQPRTECNNDRRQAIWEDAKLRGADFRATGNEPGWHMEISRSYGIALVINYGSDRYQFPATAPSSNSASQTTIYETKQGGHELMIALEGRRCTDTMSGEEFETTVTVIIDGTKLDGCGMALH